MFFIVVCCQVLGIALSSEGIAGDIVYGSHSPTRGQDSNAAVALCKRKHVVWLCSNRGADEFEGCSNQKEHGTI